MFPAGLCARPDAAGLPAYSVPAEWGVRVDDHEALLRLLRSLARRDVSAAVAHGTTYPGSAATAGTQAGRALDRHRESRLLDLTARQIAG